jgi:serine O-acetyltransferase
MRETSSRGVAEGVWVSEACICEGAGVLNTIRADIDRYVYAIEQDALSRGSHLPRLLVSPRVWSIVSHRMIHFLLTRFRPRPIGRVLAAFALIAERVIRNASGIQITNMAHLGPGLMFTHEGGIVIGPIRTGRNCTISHGVTLGRGMIDGDGPSYADTPVLGDRVWVGPGAVIAGSLAIGSDAAIGANSVVVRDVPPRAVVIGVPARLVSRRGSFRQVHYRGMEQDSERLASMEQAEQQSSAAQADVTEFIVSNYLFGDLSRTPSGGDSLVGLGVIDSTGVLELIEFLESHFDIQISENETVPENLDSITALCNFVSGKQASRKVAG